MSLRKAVKKAVKKKGFSSEAETGLLADKVVKGQFYTCHKGQSYAVLHFNDNKAMTFEATTEIFARMKAERFCHQRNLIIIWENAR